MGGWWGDPGLKASEAPPTAKEVVHEERRSARPMLPSYLETPM